MTITKRNRAVRRLASVIAHRAGILAELELTAQRDEAVAQARVVAHQQYQDWLAAGGDPADEYRRDLILETALRQLAPWGDADWRRVHEDAARSEYADAIRRGLPALRIAARRSFAELQVAARDHSTATFYQAA